jgi:deoxyribose-phosphate aldolase
MDTTKISKVISQVMLEKSLRDFYSSSESCKGWETNIITQPQAVKNIISNGADRISAGLGIGEHLSDISLSRMIDHTLLKPDATEEEIKKLCTEAKQYHFASVCINPSWVALCSSLLKGTDVKVCTVIGFPLGSNTTEVKRMEAEQALENGATELDMVINVGKLKSGDYDYVFNDVQQITLAARKVRAVCKVILETCLLTDEEKIKACLICKKAGADFVKTSTGFSKGGATVQDIALMRLIVGSSVGVKASGGIRSREDAEAMVASGADRIGASASVKIVLGEKSEANY